MEAGPVGEQTAGAVLEGLRQQGYDVLSGVRLPGRHGASIDHIAVGPAGVLIVNAKSPSGEVTTQLERLRRTGARVDKEIEGVLQASVDVEALLPPALEPRVVPVLCLVGEPQHAAPTRRAEVTIVGVSRLTDWVAGLAVFLSPAEVVDLAGVLRRQLPPASSRLPRQIRRRRAGLPAGRARVAAAPQLIAPQLIAPQPVAMVPVAMLPAAMEPAAMEPVAKVLVAMVPAAMVPVPIAPVAKVPVAKVPVAKVPVAKVPVAKVPVAKVPVAKAPVPMAPVAMTPVAIAPIAPQWPTAITVAPRSRAFVKIALLLVGLLVLPAVAFWWATTNGPGVVSAIFPAAPPSIATAAPVIPAYNSCQALRVGHPGGVASPGAKNKGRKLRTAAVVTTSQSLYAANARLDTDRDRIACEVVRKRHHKR